ncbi:MAG: aspartate-semialdehyde dehydrogenase, partial [Anaerolineae bacterium]|nr:aspartate-semialdehyde dehydrogenase [Anaerolineae bacterium]
MASKIPVAILGATGAVGQRFIQLLDQHPWFQVATLTASERSEGRPYGEACRWVLEGEMPPGVRDMVLGPSTPEAVRCPLAFSALPSSAPASVEEDLARAGVVVCSNASTHRTDPDVPILIAEVNPAHLELLEVQRRRRGWPGLLVTGPNCTSVPVAVVLRALDLAFGVRHAHVVSLQALSGAGYPGVPSLDVLDNVIPFIAEEEAKVESEPRKILGRLEGEGIRPAPFAVSAQC